MTGEASQQPVIDFLGNAASHGGLPVKRIDTSSALPYYAQLHAILKARITGGEWPAGHPMMQTARNSEFAVLTPRPPPYYAAFRSPEP